MLVVHQEEGMLGVDMKMQEYQFRNKITRFSFALMIFVVSIHTYNVDIYGLYENTDHLGLMVRGLENYIRFFERACVPFFFMISGYLFFRNYSPDKLFPKYKSRIKTVLIPYLIWCTIYYIYFVCLTRIPWLQNLINGEKADLSLGGWINSLWREQYYTLWFLKELIILILLTPVIHFALTQQRRKKVFKYAGVLFLFLVYLEKSKMISVSYNPFDFHYLVGAFIGINYRELPLARDKRITQLAWVTMPLLMIYGGWCVSQNIEWGLMTILIFCICIWLEFNIFSYEKKPKWWMKPTFFYYCMHDLILEALEKIFLIVFGRGSMFALIDYLCMPFVTIAICVAAACILKKYIPHVWSVLTGDRG